MKTQQTITQTTHANTFAEPHNFYCGKIQGGVYKLKIGGYRFYGHGKLHQCKAEQASKDLLISLASGVPKNGLMLQCIGAKTGKLYFFVGTVKLPTKNGSSEQNGTRDTNPTAPKEVPSIGHHSKKNLAITEEMQRIREAKNAGLNPSVRIEFVVHFLNMSRATIYRKMGQSQFPKPIKHGHGSFWLLSVIEQFATGEWTEQFSKTSHPVSQQEEISCPPTATDHIH